MKRAERPGRRWSIDRRALRADCSGSRQEEEKEKEAILPREKTAPTPQRSIDAPFRFTAP